MTHLILSEEDMGVISWCNATHDSSTWKDTDKIDECDCEQCLIAAFEFGIKAMRRRLFLKDGRILEKHQAIEKILEDLAHPVIFINPYPKEPR